MIAEEIQAATIHVNRLSFSNFRFIIIVRNIFLVLLRRSSHPASGSFFREDEKKNSRSTASGLDQRCTMFQVFIILIISFSYVIYFLFVWGYFSGKAGAQRWAWTRDVQYLTFLSLVYQFFLSIGSFWSTRNQHKISFEYGFKCFMGFSIDILQDYFFQCQQQYSFIHESIVLCSSNCKWRLADNKTSQELRMLSRSLSDCQSTI